MKMSLLSLRSLDPSPSTHPVMSSSSLLTANFIRAFGKKRPISASPCSGVDGCISSLLMFIPDRLRYVSHSGISIANSSLYLAFSSACSFSRLTRKPTRASASKMSFIFSSCSYVKSPVGPPCGTEKSGKTILPVAAMSHFVPYPSSSSRRFSSESSLNGILEMSIPATVLVVRNGTSLPRPIAFSPSSHLSA